MSSYCFECGDTGLAPPRGFIIVDHCPCLDSITVYEWCKRVVLHRKAQGEAMGKWVTEEWLDTQCLAAVITGEDYDRLCRVGEWNQLLLL